jgi:hypothetical protein
VFGRTKTEIEKRINYYGNSIEEIRRQGKLVGDAGQIAEQLNALAEVGCQRVMMQWLDLDDMGALEAMAKVLIPQFKR